MDKEAVLELVKDQMGLASELVRQQVAGMIFAAMVSRSSLSSVRAEARTGDMADADTAAKLANMVCDACERA